MNDAGINKIFKALKSVLMYIVSIFQLEKEEAQARAQIMQKQQKRMYVQSLMYALTNDLFYVLHGRNYYFIRAITAVADIRSLNYQECENGQFIYIYELTKTMQNIIASTILIQMKHDINADIAQAQHYLMSVYGEQAFMLTYPFLFHGIKVVGIKDTGTAIRIQIVSNYMP